MPPWTRHKRTRQLYMLLVGTKVSWCCGFGNFGLGLGARPRRGAVSLAQRAAMACMCGREIDLQRRYYDVTSRLKGALYDGMRTYER